MVTKIEKLKNKRKRNVYNLSKRKHKRKEGNN